MAACGNSGGDGVASPWMCPHPTRNSHAAGSLMQGDTRSLDYISCEVSRGTPERIAALL